MTAEVMLAVGMLMVLINVPLTLVVCWQFYKSRKEERCANGTLINW